MLPYVTFRWKPLGFHLLQGFPSYHTSQAGAQLRLGIIGSRPCPENTVTYHPKGSFPQANLPLRPLHSILFLAADTVRCCLLFTALMT